MKHPVTGEKLIEQVYHHTFANQDLYDCACRFPEDGGFPGMRDEDGIIFISFSSYEKHLIPANCKRMTKSQMQMCGCEICIDMHNMNAALTENRKARLRYYRRLLASKPPNSREYKSIA
jgi:hypothetical protein